MQGALTLTHRDGITRPSRTRTQMTPGSILKSVRGQEVPGQGEGVEGRKNAFECKQQSQLEKSLKYNISPQMVISYFLRLMNG